MGSHISGILRVRKFWQVNVYGKQMYQNVYSVVVVCSSFSLLNVSIHFRKT